MPSNVTYGSAKVRFSQALGLGVDGVADPRVLIAANGATETIMRDLAGTNPADGKPWTVRGVYVGGVDQLTFTVAAGNIFTLDAAHDVVLQVEISTATDINNGWYSDLDLSGCVDSDFANDVIFIPSGYDDNGNRFYQIPTANVGDTVTVWAKKRYVPILGNDADLLLVPNVDALCSMIIGKQKWLRSDNRTEAQGYMMDALASMKNELDGYLFDPTRSLSRKAAYLADEKTYSTMPATLGFVRARIALDLPSCLKVGKTQITRAVNRAVEWLTQRTNEFRTAGRLSVKTGLANIVYTRAAQATDILVVSDYEQIRTLVAGAIAGGDTFVTAEQRTLTLLQGQINNALETLRHSTYANDLQIAIAAGQTNTLGYFYKKLALELPDGLKLSNVELVRMVNEAAREAIQQRNSLTATELYSDLDGPNILSFSYSQNDADVLPYAEYEVIRLLFLAQQTPDQAGSLRAEAYQVMERNIAKSVTAARNQKWHCLLSLPLYTFGRVRGTIGLGLSEGGFALSDQKLARYVNEAEESIAYTPNFGGGEGEYQLGCVNGLVEMPDDVERVIYADICGRPVDIKHRSFEYLGLAQGNGVQSNCQWFNGAWRWGGNHLQDKGLSENGNRQYFVGGCSHGALRMVIRRRWMPKKKDMDVMLIQNLSAIRLKVEAKLARESKDKMLADSLEAQSERELDRQLDNYTGSATIVPKMGFPGTRRGGTRQLLKRW